MAKEDKGGVQIPADLKGLSPEDLAALETQAVEAFDALSADENIDAAGLARATELADGIDAIRGETGARETAAAEVAAARDALNSRVHGTGEDAVDGEDTVDEGAESETAAPALLAGGRRPDDTLRLKNANRLNVRLSTASALQTPKNIPLSQQFDASVLVASADIPGFTNGGQIQDMGGLVEAYQQRARSLPVGRALAGGRRIEGMYLDAATGQERFGLLGHDGDWRGANRVPIASLQRSFKHTVDMGTSPKTVWDIMQEAARPDALVAAGGWCSPSEIRYDFYNIVAMDGGIDLPTTGVQRGGVRWPTSPSFGDLASSTGLWHWTETQDIAAATGTAQSGSKTCARVPCASMNEARLEGEGVCITAGNLTTDAWPEQLSNFLRLVNAAHFHRVNAFFINSIIAGSTAVTLTQNATGSFTANLLAGIEHQVWDIRTKFAMADSDVLEVILPSWVKGIVRADMSRRNGFDSPNDANIVTDSQLAGWFTERYVSVQFVQDFDVRAANQFGQASATALQASWPTAPRFIIYPAGTWLRGNGLNLDLGIIRDSTLNATNDYTAAWSEEFFLLAKIGHESRIVTLGSSVPTGASGLPTAVTGV